ncbi:undecaprenyl-diphosphate phosphatase [Clostridium sp. AF18-27]|mgnify:FL=1|uniref:Undecaprenyl-diphosphatase n=2 Tax=Enterocloster TaxID=2719313 RepID=A0A1I0JJ82_9FIRM|nr:MULTISPECIES: undecaprenyl-diphosphate phosphatase [Enterocloster]MBS5606809.1 undecaprenyl-diphosphate phosphatase [Enterocloster asparagiformis]RHR55250.1 undecaprenyl-diphosphate phosphatase [Clostridium sp. AF18-27]MCB6346457.1 undecaprenyl-diphosphate phosphatase [Enterocloster lavalensis]MDR3756340.1 undecaprenyl-diphosphate phosphatase [Enterocloster sp.]PST30424.1 undecaprenyl-diphosphate phosphatase [Enterocloster lavalensis]
MSLVETLKIIVLGIVEGFTEWLPISSTGHMILVDEIIHLNQPEAFKEVFRVVIQLGAILAVVIMYFNRLNPFSRQKTSRQRDATWALWIKIVVACVPAAVLGLLLDDWMEAHLFNAYVVAAMLIIYGVLFILVENSRRFANPDLQKVGQIPIQTAFYIGMFQVLSLVPGTSRSGATILGAMILGCSRGAAAEFSFFLGIPVMFGASFLKLVKYFLDGNSFTGPQIFYTVFGMLIAFLVSVYSIKFLMNYVRKNDFKFFGYYRIILGVIVLAYFGITALAA